ncbi:MAG: hypothetical protein JOY93_11905 [Acidobacteriales bacterium]|nr:hypothetical protein [Terriglobales bacterium]
MLVVLISTLSQSKCISFSEAASHIGENHCVSGKVLYIEHNEKGLTYLNFCEKSHPCPFAVVVFPADLKRIGDVRNLQGTFVEIHGRVKEYGGRAQIVLEGPGQLREQEAMAPSLLNSYDVEEKGHYSAGTFHAPKKHAAAAKRKTATIPLTIPEDGPD